MKMMKSICWFLKVIRASVILSGRCHGYKVNGQEPELNHVDLVNSQQHTELRVQERNQAELGRTEL